MRPRRTPDPLASLQRVVVVGQATPRRSRGLAAPRRTGGRTAPRCVARGRGPPPAAQRRHRRRRSTSWASTRRWSSRARVCVCRGGTATPTAAAGDLRRTGASYALRNAPTRDVALRFAEFLVTEPRSSHMPASVPTSPSPSSSTRSTKPARTTEQRCTTRRGASGSAAARSDAPGGRWAQLAAAIARSPARLTAALGRAQRPPRPRRPPLGSNDTPIAVSRMEPPDMSVRSWGLQRRDSHHRRKTPNRRAETPQRQCCSQTRLR